MNRWGVVAVLFWLFIVVAVNAARRLFACGDSPFATCVLSKGSVLEIELMERKKVSIVTST